MSSNLIGTPGPSADQDPEADRRGPETREESSDDLLRTLEGALLNAEETIKEAMRIRDRLRSTNSFWLSLLVGAYVAAAVAIYPFLGELLSKPALLGVLLGLGLVAFLATFLRTTRTSEQRRNFAERHIEVVGQLRDRTASLEQALLAVRQENESLIGLVFEKERTALPTPIVNLALEVLSDTLRIPLAKTLQADPCVTPLPPDDLRQYLLGLLQYCALLLEPEPSERIVRCGLLLSHPLKAETYIPVLTYSPLGSASYVSEHTFTSGDYPAWLVRQFEANKRAYGFQRYCWNFEGDVLAYARDPAEIPPKFRYKDDAQREYLKCLLGVVIYVREEPGGTEQYRPIALLNFDAPKPFAFTDEVYERMLPHLKVAYRILAMRLAGILNDEAFIKELYRRPLT